MHKRSSKLMELLGVDMPIIQAPMAGANDAAMAVGVAKAGGLGSLPCAMLDLETMRTQIKAFQAQTDAPLNVNFFCHTMPDDNPERASKWKEYLSEYYDDLGLDRDTLVQSVDRMPFDDKMCSVVEDLRPGVVSFHFGLPEKSLLARLKSCEMRILGCATSVEEARFLEANGCDAIIAQGYEAGGHRGMFLTKDITTQAGTFALLPQIVDAVSIPVIAAGGVADGRGIAAAFLLGASAVQIGTAYLFTQEALITDMHRTALLNHSVDNTAITNLFSGKPARGVVNKLMREKGPLSDRVPAFPKAGDGLAPLKKKAEAKGNADFSSLWSGQAAGLCSTQESAETLTRQLMNNAIVAWEDRE